MITEDYVSLETAKLLKEKGFDSMECHNSPNYAYNMDGQFSGPSWDTEYVAPTLQMAMKWLREVHNIDISVTPDRKTGYSVLIFKDKRLPFDTLDSYSTYEQACEAAIRYCLENLV